MTDTDMLYMASLEKRNEELGIRIAELEGKHHNECGQIAHYSDENAKLKELLKEAVDDFQFLSEQYCEKNCACCPLDKEDFCEWKHQDEALALIGEDGAENDS